MEQTGYPLHIIQDYALPRADAESFLEIVSRLSRRSLDKVSSVSRKRLELLPISCYVMLVLLRAIRPAQIMFSAYGLREGYLFDRLDPDERGLDPLLAAAETMAREHRRFGLGGGELAAWTDALFDDDDDERRRLRRAAAILADIGWSEHPDYRHEQAFTAALRMPVPGLDHAGRVFIATALHARYGGNADADDPRALRLLLPSGAFERARAVGLALRLGYTLTGGAPGLIARTRLSVENGDLVLAVPRDQPVFAAEAAQRRLDALGRALGRRATLVQADPPEPSRRRARG
jgi:exopolyphosphatase/guanosine-5'-triphosphate,3'-diphosphate pyrophosphatase